MPDGRSKGCETPELEASGRACQFSWGLNVDVIMCVWFMAVSGGINPLRNTII